MTAQELQSSDTGYHRLITVEDFTSLSLGTSKLSAEKPVLGEKNEFPTFTRELIQVKWRAGDPIDLYIIRPKGIEKPPAVLYLYSYPSETDRFKDDGFCERVTRDGVAAIGFVSALTGHRYQNRPMKQWFVSELQESLSSTVHDVQMILTLLSSRDDLDLEHVGMFGSGSGATIAVLAASVNPRIKAIDLLDPWGDWPDWMAKSDLIPEEERTAYVKPEFLNRIMGFDPVRVLPLLKSQRIRIQHVLDDDVTPRIAKEKIEAAAPSGAQIARFDDTKQFLASASGGRVFQWIKEQLKADLVANTPTPDSQSSKPTIPKSEGGNDN